MKARKNWRIVRLQVITVQRLRRMSEMWYAAYGGPSAVPEPHDRWGHSLDRVISVLLDRDDAHRARAARRIASTRRAKRQGKAKGGQQPEADSAGGTNASHVYIDRAREPKPPEGVD